MRARKILLSALVVGIVAAVSGAATWSAFSGTTSNAGNTFASGTVTISDNDGGSALLSLADALPGASTSGCIKTTYAGSLAAGVKLYGTVSGTLAQHLTLTVTRGTQTTGTFPECGDFAPDGRDYVGQGNGVVYQGDLSSFPASFAAGIDDPEAASGSPETWTAGEAHTYKLEVTLQNAPAAEGQSATANFTWEARNQ